MIYMLVAANLLLFALAWFLLRRAGKMWRMILAVNDRAGGMGDAIDNLRERVSDIEKELSRLGVAKMNAPERWGKNW